MNTIVFDQNEMFVQICTIYRMYLLERRLNTETLTGVHGLGFYFHKQRAFKKDEEVSPIFV